MLCRGLTLIVMINKHWLQTFDDVDTLAFGGVLVGVVGGREEPSLRSLHPRSTLRPRVVPHCQTQSVVMTTVEVEKHTECSVLCCVPESLFISPHKPSIRRPATTESRFNIKPARVSSLPWKPCSTHKSLGKVLIWDLYQDTDGIKLRKQFTGSTTKYFCTVCLSQKH